MRDLNTYVPDKAKHEFVFTSKVNKERKLLTGQQGSYP